MALVTDLELPAFDYTDVSMRGDALPRGDGRAALERLARAGAVRLHRARPGVLRVLPAPRAAIFPGLTIAECSCHHGPLYEQMRRNILHVNGPDHSRLRSLVNPALSPRAVERYRPLMRGFLEELFAAVLARPPASRGAGGRVAVSSWRRSPSPTRRS